MFRKTKLLFVIIGICIGFGGGYLSSTLFNASHYANYISHMLISDLYKNREINNLLMTKEYASIKRINNVDTENKINIVKALLKESNTSQSKRYLDELNGLEKEIGAIPE